MIVKVLPPPPGETMMSTTVFYLIKYILKESANVALPKIFVTVTQMTKNSANPAYTPLYFTISCAFPNAQPVISKMIWTSARNAKLNVWNVHLPTTVRDSRKDLD